MSNVIQDLERAQLRNVPRFKAGDTVRVHFQVIEGTRRRVQVFEGIVLKRQGAGARETFTVRKQSFGVGVERTFPLHSPKIEKIEVAAIGDVNRAKLYYLRGRVGKKARVRERRYGAGSELPVAVEATLAETEGVQAEAAVEAGRRRGAAVRGARPSRPRRSRRPRSGRGRGARWTRRPRTAEAGARGERPSPRPPKSPSRLPPSNDFPEFAARAILVARGRRYPRREVKRTGQKLLRFDRRLGARFVAGADEAGRGSLAGPLVVAGVLLDYGSLRDHRVRPLGFLNDSKQCSPERREDLFRAVVGCAERVAVRVIPPGEIDRNGLHRSNLAGLRAMLEALTPPAEACLVDGFRLGSAAPEHTAVVDGDEKSAAIAAASIVAKVTRDRLMRRLDALYPAYGFAQHVGYITPGHSAVVRARGPSAVHRLSFQALCYEGEEAVA